MLRRRNKDLRVIGEPEDPTDKIVEQIMTELNKEDSPEKDMEKLIKQHKKSFRTRVAVITAVVLAAVVGIYLLLYLQTYQTTRVVDSYTSKGSENNSYKEFAGGVLKYSRDGIAYLNEKGQEQWNQPYQIKNPSVEICQGAAAVADQGGNDIMVFLKSGLKGEIHTTLPIEKIAVSEQGIVSAILKNESSPKIMCYDTAGNVLVEHKASLTGSGYPLDVSLSGDGEVMLVSYLYTQNGKITSKAIYYNFGKAGEDKTDHQVMSKEYDNTVIPETFFMNNNISVLAGDDRLIIYKGLEAPAQQANIEIDKEMKSVFHNDKYIGMVLKNEGKEGYELRLYNTSGKQIMSEDFTGDYDNVKLSGQQILMYDGKKCSIFMKTGIQRFEGELRNNIIEMFPVMGINKYIVMNADGMEIVRLVK